MFSDLLPKRIDNTYRGRPAALWLLAVVVSVKMLQSVVVLFNGYSIARSADGIPVETFPAAAAQTVVALFMISGFSRLLLCVGCVLTLLRYRSAVVLMFVVLAVDYLGRQLVLTFQPIVRTGAPIGPYVNVALFALTLIGFALSFPRRGAAS